MIISETVEINGKSYTKTYSNNNKYITRDSVLYVDAVDNLGTDRTYTETDQDIEHPEPESLEAKVQKIENKTEKNISDIEYIAMMTDIDLGV